MTGFKKIFILVFIGVICEITSEIQTELISDEDIPELAYLNKSVDPCENFYKFTCGNFKNVQEMPQDKNTKIWDHFTILQNDIHQLVQDILESTKKPKDSIALKKAKTFYHACANTKYIDKLVLSQLHVLNKLGTWPVITNEPFKEKFSWDELGNIVAEYGVQFFLNLQVIPNNYNATENVIILSEDSLANPTNIVNHLEPNPDEYLGKLLLNAKDEALIPLHIFFNKIAFKLRDLSGTFKRNVAISRDVEETIAFMRNISGKGIIEENVTITPLPRTPTITELQKWTDDHFGLDFGLNWMSFLQNVFRKSGVKIHPEMKLMSISTNNTYGLLNLVRRTDDRILKNFIFARLFTYMAPDSDSYMRNAFNEFYDHFNWPIYPRERYCVRKILGYTGFIDLSYALTYEYQKYHFNINKVNEAQEMVEDLHDAFKDILRDNNWMDANAKEKAIKKVENMITLLAFPDYADDEKLLNDFYRNLRVCSWDHSGNAQRLRAFRQALNFQQLGDTIRRRDVWTFSPLEVNAVYNRPNNRILFPISMLNPVFFNGKISALDYGRIGAIIGHEITHGFDDSGRLYDEDCNFVNWWNEETQAGYKEIIKCYKDQYSKYYIEEIDSYVNADKTLNENIADNGGLREAYKAFQKLQKRRSPILTVAEYTPEQLFFIGFGTMWCMTETNYYLTEMQKYSYSPGRYRVIGPVSNMVEFSEAFGCSRDSPMNPPEKCVLW